MHRHVPWQLTKLLLAPMLVFTADEAWEQIPHKPAADAGLFSVHLALLPEPSGVKVSDAQRAEWNLLMELRNQGTQQLDGLKKSVGLNKAGEAEAVFEIGDEASQKAIEKYGVDLEDLVGAGSHSFAPAAKDAPPAVKIVDRRNDYKACARSWKRRPDVGQDPAFPDLSLRDAKAMRIQYRRRRGCRRFWTESGGLSIGQWPADRDRARPLGGSGGRCATG